MQQPEGESEAMIHQVIKQRTPRPFGELARYIAATEKNEKLGSFWAVNCRAGDSIDRLDHIINEVEATQALNIRATSDKSHHLVLSFKDERPPESDVAEIEKKFAHALGLGEHQRVIATHINTAYFHAHIGYNKVHPRTLKIVDLSYNYYTAMRVARAVEKEFGLKEERDILYRRGRNSLPTKAAEKETLTWQQSFAGYVMELGPMMDRWLAIAATWDELHADFAKVGLKIEPRGKGLVIQDIGHRGRMVKASMLGSDFGKPGMERLLGPFEPARFDRYSRVVSRFESRPLTKHSDQQQLWEDYLAAGAVNTGPGEPSGWRYFLKQAAVHDPLAWDIVDLHERQLKEASLKKETDLSRGMSP